MQRKLKVLHLEDEPLDSELVQQLLHEEGLEAQIDRRDELQGFRQALEEGGYALILADYTIPRTDPLEALRVARQLRPELPFIFLSGTIGEDTAIETMKLGASDYVLKQRMGRLAPAVKRALQEAEAQARRHLAEAQLQEANRALARANGNLERIVLDRTARLRKTIDELESFSATLSHDLRAPLRAIQTFSELLVRFQGAKLDPSGLDYLREITTAARRLETLIQDVLIHSRMAREPVRLQPVNPQALVEQLIRENPAWQPPAAHIHIQRPLHPVLGHASFLTQCLANLIHNAVKFVSPGQVPRVRIRTEATPGPPAQPEPVPAGPEERDLPAGAGARQALGSVAVDGAARRGGELRVRLWVEDNGIGIPKTEQGRLFELFQRVHANYEGTGLGLSIVRKAAERMGGSVGVESEPGQGSRFWVELKAAEPCPVRKPP